MVFHWSLNDSKSPQVSRTLRSILLVFINVVVWMVSTRSSTSKSSRPFNNPFVTVPLLLLYYLHWSFSLVFHWSLSDHKSPQVSRTLLSNNVNLNNVVVWIVSTRPPTSKSSREWRTWKLASLLLFPHIYTSLFLFPHRFGRYVHRPSSGVCRTREPSRNFEPRPLLNPRGSPVLILLAITGCKC